jgi:hypothetical protein
MVPPSFRPSPGRLRRLAPALLLIPAIAAAGTLGPRWPHDQVLRYDLGDAASRVERLDVRLSPGTTDEVAREASFRYAVGRAPRLVTHEPRLANGDYTVEVDITAAGRQAATHRRVTLSGGTTTLDLGPVVP